MRTTQQRLSEQLQILIVLQAMGRPLSARLIATLLLLAQRAETDLGNSDSAPRDGVAFVIYPWGSAPVHLFKDLRDLAYRGEAVESVEGDALFYHITPKGAAFIEKSAESLLSTARVAAIRQSVQDFGSMEEKQLLGWVHHFPCVKYSAVDLAHQCWTCTMPCALEEENVRDFAAYLASPPKYPSLRERARVIR